MNKNLRKATLLLMGIIGTLSIWVVNAEDGITFNPDAWVTYTDTNGNIFSWIWTITLTYSGKSITMLDRNLWATSNNRNDESSYWYVFQWWNNHGFDLSTPSKTTSTMVSADEYQRNNPYVSGTFVLSEYWDDSYNAKLWWWAEDFNIDRWINTSDDGYTRQWPCPAGYHVPSIWEWDEILRMFRGLTGSAQLNTWTDGWYYIESNPFGSAFIEQFYIPIPWYLWYDWNLTWQLNDEEFSYDYFRSSSFRKSPGWWFFTVRYSPKSTKRNRLSSVANHLKLWNAFSIRCFKNTAPEWTEITLSYNTRGGSAIQAQTLPIWATGYLPWHTTSRNDAILSWWYEKNLINEFDFENTVLTENTMIYARWSDDYEVTFIDRWREFDKQVVKNSESLEKPIDPERDWSTFLWWFMDDWTFENEFIFWETEITGNISLYAKRWYLIKFLDGDENILNSGFVIEWDMPTYSWATPTKLATSDYTYTFNGNWLPEITAASQNIEYVAQFDVTPIKKWNNYSGWWGRRDSSKTEEYWSGELGDIQSDENISEVEWFDEKYDSDYSLEMNRAYQFAKEKWITTMETIENAKMNAPLTRIAMAKMLSYYAINVLWEKPDESRINKFNDVTEELDKKYDNGVTLAYQLWIMWINMSDNMFRPNDKVNRWEFGTALSRMLFGIADWDKIYHEPHLKKLKEEWIITNDDPHLQEIRWYVMIMLMRSAK